MKLLLTSIIIVILSSCSTTLSTEETVEEFTLSLSEGRCEDAIMLTTGTINETVQQHIDMGCEEFKTTVDSVLCKIDDDKARCRCFETRNEIQMAFSYNLLKTGDSWKIKEHVKGADLFWNENLEDAF